LKEIPFSNSVQTNATLLDEEWLDIFRNGNFSIGISLDGLPKQHDSSRVFPNGKGSYDLVKNAIHLLNNKDLSFQTLVVIDPNYSASATISHLLDLGCNNLDFLLPMSNYIDELKDDIREKCADFLIELFDTWFSLNDPNIRIRYFESLICKLLNGQPQLCTFHNNCSNILTIEPDGNIGLCDDMNIVEDVNLFRSGLNIKNDSFSEIENWLGKQIQSIGMNNLPFQCCSCEILPYCNAGCPSMRFSPVAQFEMPHFYCYTFKKVIDHIIQRISMNRIEKYREKAAYYAFGDSS
jgi:uncharacterized protein